MVAITVIESPERFADLAAEWRALSTRAIGAHLFNTFDWLEAWWTAFAEPGDRLRIYGVRREGRLVAIAPLMAHAAAPRQWRSIFNHYLGRSDFLVDPDHPDALDELLGAITQDADLWDVTELVQVPEVSALFSSLARRPPPGVWAHAVRNIASPYLDLKGRTYDAWSTAQFSGKKRQLDRRRQRQAEKHTGYSLRALKDPADTTAAFGECLQVEHKSWKGEAQSSMQSDPKTRAFMEDVVARFSARGEVTLITLDLEGAQAAFLLGFTFRGCFYFHKTGYDPHFQAVSPGRIVLLESLRLAFAQGLSRYDFLGAADDYKLQCTSSIQPHVTIFLYHGGLRSRLERALKRTVVPAAKLATGRGPRFEVRLDVGG